MGNYWRKLSERYWWALPPARIRWNQAVESAPLVRGLSEHLKQHDEESQRLVLLDEFISKIDDHETAGTQNVRHAMSVVDAFFGELKPQ